MTGEALIHRLLFLPPQASTLARAVDHLHYFVIITTMIGSAGVAVTTAWFLARWRRRSEDQRSFHVEPSRTFEALVVSGPLSLFLLWFVLGFRGYVELYTPPAGAMDVYVTAKQWMWKFSYPAGPDAIGVLRVPEGRPVRLLMTSRDVIHSFFVPDFRVKQDVLPGRYTETWFTAIQEGPHELLCAEYCGLGHSMMRAAVDVLPPDRFDAWLAEQRRGLAAHQDSGGPLGTPPARTALAEEGERVAVKAGCFKCHTIDGTSHIGPTWLGLYHRREPLSDGRRVYVDEAYLTRSMMDPMADIVAGFEPVMPTFQGKLDAPEAAALVELIKSLQDRERQSQPAPPPVYGPLFQK